MKTFAVLLVSCVFTAPVWAQGAQREELDATQKNDPPAVVHWARGEAHTASNRGGSPNMTWHGDVVKSSVTVQPIFWGSSWTTSQEKIDGLETWYLGVGGSKYAQTNSEYVGKNGTQFISAPVTYTTYKSDFTAGPTKAPSTSTILGEVCKVADVVANGYYPVYVDLKRGHAGYCAWHSWGSCGGVPIQFAFFFNLDGDAGCDPQDTSGLHSQGLAALANVTGHEFSETVTDPNGMSWYDSQGAENADKCAWTFSGSLLTFNNSAWKIQGNWSNAAYNANSGYSKGGCIDGNQ